MADRLKVMLASAAWVHTVSSSQFGFSKNFVDFNVGTQMVTSQ